MKKYALILSAALVLLAVACSGGDKKESASSTPSGAGAAPQPTSSPAPSAQPSATSPASGAQATPSAAGGGIADAELSRIASAVGMLRSFRSQVSVEAGGTKYDAQLEWVAPNRQRVLINGAAFGAPGTVEMITIGADVYMKLGSTWTRQAIPGGTGFDANAVANIVEAVKSLGSNAVKGGTATVTGKTCQIYTVKSGNSSNEYCIADNLPLRVVTESPGSKLTITFSDYNANIDIRAPI
jgi:hypothetical protein